MRLFDSLSEKCRKMQLSKVPDGEGGYYETWSDGAEFDAAIVLNDSALARIADKDDGKATYTVTVSKDASLGALDVFKRVSDGKVLRITSDPSDKATPQRATFSFKQFTAEAWAI